MSLKASAGGLRHRSQIENCRGGIADQANWRGPIPACAGLVPRECFSWLSPRIRRYVYGMKQTACETSRVDGDSDKCHRVVVVDMPSANQ